MRVEKNYYRHHKEELGRPRELSATYKSSGLPKVEEYNKNRPVSNVSYGGSVSFSGLPKIMQNAGKKVMADIPKIGQKTGRVIASIANSTFDAATRKVQSIGMDKAGKKVLKDAYQAIKDARPAKEWAVKLGKSTGFGRILNFVGENSGLFDAFNALILTGTLKPILVLAMPGAEDEDKEQIATKNFVAAMIGFVISLTVLGALSQGSKGVINKAREVFMKNPDIAHRLETDPKYKEDFGDIWQKGMEIVIAPTKAALTVALMPRVTKAIFGKKNEEKEQEKLEKEYANILPLGIKMSPKDEQLFKKPFVSEQNVKHDNETDEEDDD